MLKGKPNSHESQNSFSWQLLNETTKSVIRVAALRRVVMWYCRISPASRVSSQDAAFIKLISQEVFSGENIAPSSEQAYP